MKRIGLVIAVFVTAALLTGCSEGVSEAPTSRAPSPEPPAIDQYAFDPLELGASNRVRSQVETTAPTVLSASQAIDIASERWHSVDASPAFVTTREVVYSFGEVDDTVVWLVGAAPVPVHRHGPQGGVGLGRVVYAVDASTGAILSMSASGIPES